jgi:hypothetical protein
VAIYSLFGFGLHELFGQKEACSFHAQLKIRESLGKVLPETKAACPETANPLPGSGQSLV